MQWPSHFFSRPCLLFFLSLLWRPVPRSRKTLATFQSSGEPEVQSTRSQSLLFLNPDLSKRIVSPPFPAGSGPTVVLSAQAFKMQLSVWRSVACK